MFHFKIYKPIRYFWWIFICRQMTKLNALVIKQFPQSYLKNKLCMYVIWKSVHKKVEITCKIMKASLFSVVWESCHIFVIRSLKVRKESSLRMLRGYHCCTSDRFIWSLFSPSVKGDLSVVWVLCSTSSEKWELDGYG